MKKRLVIVLIGFLLSMTIWIGIQSYMNRFRRDADEITEISLERKGCYGGCPVYSVVLTKKKALASYTGVGNVDRIGRYDGAANFSRLAL